MESERRKPDGPIITVGNALTAKAVRAPGRHPAIVLTIAEGETERPALSRDGNTTFVNVPTFCNAPFPFVVITIDGENVHCQQHELSMAENLALWDRHLHTQMAYCNKTMTIEDAIAVSRVLGLAGIGFAEHSGQLYFDKQRYWDRSCLREGMAAAVDADNRMDEYLGLKLRHAQESVGFGLEVDCDYHGNLLLRSDDRLQFDHILGAIHGLPALTRERPPQKSDSSDFLHLVQMVLEAGVDVLAHPFRVFRRSGWEPPVEFIRICLDSGVMLSFGSDAHDLSEIGDFASHLAVLKAAGFDGVLSDVLAP